MDVHASMAHVGVGVCAVPQRAHPHVHARGGHRAHAHGHVRSLHGCDDGDDGPEIGG